VDVSSHQHPRGRGITWRSVRRAGISFAIAKATEGRSYLNPYFAADWTNARAAGMVPGAYHYALPARPLVANAAWQARWFVLAIRLTMAGRSLPPVLDLEHNGGLQPRELAAWTRSFMVTVESLTGRTPILYTFRRFWRVQMGNTGRLAAYPLWYAIYNGQARPGTPPGGWLRWAAWQFTSRARVPGIAGNVDMNLLCCSGAALLRLSDSRTEINRRYAGSSVLRWLLGRPTGAETAALGGGRWRAFQRGVMIWSAGTGTRVVFGGIALRYIALGGTRSPLGKPVSDERNATVGRQTLFQKGRIYWTRLTGAHSVRGGILAHYLAMGGSGSSLGPPTRDEYAVRGGRESAFAHGWLRWQAATRTVTLRYR
jgi:GH25 family lysozyme M1 (1,4-beta-N-acetylmuramidase)